MFVGVETATAQGYTFFFYGPDRKLPFATLATQGNEYDRPRSLRRITLPSKGVLKRGPPIRLNQETEIS